MNYSFVGYGSLISHKSLSETIHNKPFIPITIKGYKRIFNLTNNSNNPLDLLNLKKFSKSKFNGVLFKVNEKELRAIKEREPEYNLESTWAYDFLTGKKLCKCFIVIDYTVGIDKSKRKPDKNYFILCREAAYYISKEFGEYWDKTTFTSDGEDIAKWIKTHKAYDTISKKI